MPVETYVHNIRSSEDNQKHFINTIRYIDGVPFDQDFRTVNVNEDNIVPVDVPEPQDGEDRLDPIKEAVKQFAIANFNK